MKTHHPAAPGLPGVERSGLQHPPHRAERLPALSVCAEFPAVDAGLCGVPEIHLWKAGEKAHDQDPFL